MSWRVLARLECERLLRSWGIWVFAVVLVLNINWSLHPTLGAVPVDDSTTVLGAFQQGLVSLVAVGGVLASFQSVAQERESGALRTHLALPQSRAEILLGKVLGRSLALVAMLVPVFVAGAILAFVTYGVVDVVGVGVIWLLTTGYAFVGVSIGVAISASVRTGRTATAVTLGYTIVLLLWRSTFAPQLFDVLRGYVPGSNAKLFFVLGRLAPTSAYNVLTNAVIGVGNSAAPWIQVVFALDPRVQTNFRLVVDAFETIPLSLWPLTSLIVLAGWAVVSVGIAYLRFRGADVLSTSRR